MKCRDMLKYLKIILLFVFAFALTTGSSPAKTVAYAERISPSHFQIDFIDVGQGDSALVQCDGHYMLVDGGNSKRSSLIYSYLKSRSVSYLDVIVATHPDSDHIGGLSGALNYADAGVALCSATKHDTRAFNSFVKYLNKRGKSITVPKAGDTFMLGSAVVTIVGPIAHFSESNNNSIVLRIEYGDTSFLLTGDAEYKEENSILDSGQVLQSTVLKVGHHGSEYSTGYRFLREVSPTYAVISCGKDNKYGHPTEAVLSKLRDADVKTYRTDLQGDIICISDGKTVSFSVKRNADADTLAGSGEGQKSSAAVSDTYDIQAPEAGSGSDDNKAAGESKNTDAVASYVLNRNTRKFHVPTCSSVSQMKEKNKIYFTGTRQEVIDQHYTPCRNCNP